MQRNSIGTVIQLSKEDKKKITDEITAFYLDIGGEEMGLIEQQQIMDLFLENLAPVIYNKALDDAQYWYRKQQENLESDFYSLYRDIR